MTPPIDNEQPLRTLRELPTEVNLEQVGRMVAAFTVAATAGSLLTAIKLNLNSILMTTAGSLLLGGSIYIMTAGDPAPREARSAVAAPVEITEETVAEEPAVVFDMPVAEQGTTPSAGTGPIANPPEPTAAPPSPEPEAAPAVVLRLPYGARSYDLKGFTGVQLASSIDVTVSEGEFSVKAVGDESALDRLRIVVENGLLCVDKDHGKPHKNGCGGSASVLVRMPQAQRFEVLGSGNIAVGRFRRAENLQLGLAGSGNLLVEAVGEARSLTINNEGSGDILLDETVVAGAATIRVAGSGNVRVSCRAASLDINVEGPGDVVLSGMVVAGAATMRIAHSGDVRMSGRTASLGINVEGSGGVVLGEMVVAGAATVRIAHSGDVRMSGRAASLDINVTSSGHVVAGDMKAATVKARITGSGDVYVNSGSTLDSETTGSGRVHRSGSSGGQRPRGVGAMSQ